MSKKYSVLVTGGAGFIGSALCQKIVKKSNFNLIILDKLTYASNWNKIKNIINNEDVFFYKGSIGNQKILNEILIKFKPIYIFNLAAETHVDNSILNPSKFIKTNILDTHNFLRVLLKYYKNLNKKEANKFKFLQISTDEVYGDIELIEKPVNELKSYNPSSPYSASKAAGDHLVKAYFRTFDFPGLVSNCCNNFGPFQHHEKFIPVIIKSLLENKKIPVYGNGLQIREWIYIDDHCNALLKLIESGKIGESYNIGTGFELTNFQMIERIFNCMRDLSLIKNVSIKECINFIEDRPGHDKRYSLNSSKINKLCGWKPLKDFNEGLKETIYSFVKK